MRLALREIKVDVPQSRLVSLEPHPVFVPLFRRILLLREAAPGVFVPTWSPELVERLKPLKLLPGHTPDRSPAAGLLSAPSVPVAIIEEYANLALGRWFAAARRQAGREGEVGRVVELVHPAAPALKSDHRLSVKRVDDLDSLPADAADFLWTPFLVQQQAAKLPQLLSTVGRVLAPSGAWAFVDLMPASMPGYWLYRFFPEAWENERPCALDTSRMYNALREAGFDVRLERRTVYRVIELGQVLRVARRRERVARLADLPDPVYDRRLADLEAMVRGEGAGAVVASELCLVEVLAVWG